MSADFRQILRDRGLKQVDIAKMLEVSEPTVTHWFNGWDGKRKRRVPAEKARAMAQLLGVHPHDIRPDLFDAPPQVAA